MNAIRCCATHSHTVRHISESWYHQLPTRGSPSIGVDWKKLNVIVPHVINLVHV